MFERGILLNNTSSSVYFKKYTQKTNMQTRRVLERYLVTIVAQCRLHKLYFSNFDILAKAYYQFLYYRVQLIPCNL